ncbi:MAG: 16S rRNA (guanine(527)-N(7))-methyltransferase RsmG [Roseiarcus sp.]|jgi:16S rRNA (guanine527-N7)-methyltransferase|uniref:16S rRNA (guanine(527)-N(7))-methyltransferase RsmG n=1 Tax=Roseiarcus sp. TaxID=1969460 RepID=UPI003BAEE3E1
MSSRPSARFDLARRLLKDRATALRLVPVSRETEERLALFVDLLARWRTATNLISETTFASVWTRHVADSAQLLAFAPGASRWVDMGSGAGFPGLVIAIQLAGVPGAVVHCIESDRRKCAFLREAARATAAPAQIHAMRVEAVDPAKLGPVDAVTARAFAPLPLTLKLATVWLDEGATGIFPRGRSAKDQLEALGIDRAYTIEVLPSAVDAEAAILKIRVNREPAHGRDPHA